MVSCRYRRIWQRADWIAAAYEFGSDVAGREEHLRESRCILPNDDRHDDMPHLVVNPWTKAVHAYDVELEKK